MRDGYLSLRVIFELNFNDLRLIFNFGLSLHGFHKYLIFELRRFVRFNVVQNILHMFE